MNIDNLKNNFSYFKFSYQSLFKILIVILVGIVFLVRNFDDFIILGFLCFLFISLLPFMTMKIFTDKNYLCIVFGGILKKNIKFDSIKSVRILNKEENYGIYRFYARSLWGIKIALFPFRLIFDISDGSGDYLEIIMINGRVYLIGISSLYDSKKNAEKLKEIILNRVKLINLKK